MENNPLRRRIIEKSYESNLKHVGSAFSCLDTVAYLFSEVLDKDHDIFIMSKGHGAMALYAVLETYGKNPSWDMHPKLDENNGIYATTGSLGHGLPIAIGRAFAKKQKNQKGIVNVLLGDCEMSEGSVWESLIIANSLKIDNINLFVDWNKYGASGPVQESTNLEKNSLMQKLKAFGCNTYFINGHDYNDLKNIKNLEKGLNAVVLDTIKGKGILELEQTHSHGFSIPNNERYHEIIQELSR